MASEEMSRRHDQVCWRVRRVDNANGRGESGLTTTLRSPFLPMVATSRPKLHAGMLSLSEKDSYPRTHRTRFHTLHRRSCPETPQWSKVTRWSTHGQAGLSLLHPVHIHSRPSNTRFGHRCTLCACCWVVCVCVCVRNGGSIL